MKKILLASTILATMTGVAAAADLPSRMAPPVYAPPPLPVFTWTGAYFGINAGYAFDHEGRFSLAPTDPAAIAAVGAGVVPGGAKVSSDGFTGGGQIGYNYQFGGFGGYGGGIVVGIEADAAYTDLESRRTLDPAGLGVNTRFVSGLDYLGTVRGRLGYSFGQFLVYGTGGFAYGNVNNRFDVFVPAAGAGSFASARQDRMETGYAYGGGVEYALPTTSFLNFFKSSAVTIKAEYLHYDLGRSNMNVTDTTGAITGAAGTSLGRVRVTNEGDLVRVGLNYKFGSF